MTSFVLPSGITLIDTATFAGCNRLKSIVIPCGVTSIADYAFGDCGSLQYVIIPDSVISIGEEAFSDCPDLLFICSDNSYAAKWAEQNSIPHAKCLPKALANPSIILPSHLKKIESESFKQIPYGSIISIPSNIKTIAQDAFDLSSFLLCAYGSNAQKICEELGFHVIVYGE